MACPSGHVTHRFLRFDEASDCCLHESRAAACLEVVTLVSPTPSFVCDNEVAQVPYTLVCDHRMDCTDGSDEKNCPVDDLKCDYPSWRCDNDSKCLDVKDLCNGQYDCEDETDEGARCQFNLCADFNTCSGMYFFISFTFYYLIMRVIVMIFKS